jgi:hypothetical protein
MAIRRLDPEHAQFEIDADQPARHGRRNNPPLQSEKRRVDEREIGGKSTNPVFCFHPDADAFDHESARRPSSTAPRTAIPITITITMAANHWRHERCTDRTL